jgi:hypothetical protein
MVFKLQDGEDLCQEIYLIPKFIFIYIKTPQGCFNDWNMNGCFFSVVFLSGTERLWLILRSRASAE